MNADLLLFRRELYSFFRCECRDTVFCMQAFDERCAVEVCLLDGAGTVSLVVSKDQEAGK